jgi:hypothetical protein
MYEALSLISSTAKDKKKTNTYINKTVILRKHNEPVKNRKMFNTLTEKLNRDGSNFKNQTNS